MSHRTITIFENKELFEHQRSMNDERKDVIYNVLNAKEFYNESSGSGESKFFSENEIRKALDFFENYNDYKEIDFLKRTLMFMINKSINQIEIKFN